jgi:predicted ATPase/DNA-binding winged helix-turn-helix (wHTH) protein
VSEASPNLVYACGQWEIDLGRRELRAAGSPVPLGSRAFEIVEVLVRSASSLVTKDDLMQRVWPDATVGEATLPVHISAVRKALGPDRHLVKTAQGRGYRLLGEWAAQEQGSKNIPPALQHQYVSAVLQPTNFSPLVTGLIGRSAAVQRVRDLISAYRVVTLTGPGGIGKTVLATKAAHGLTADFDGAWLVELASEPDLVPTAVASVLGLRLSGEEVSAEALARSVGEKKLLLILDNCEHVIDAAANFVETFVRMCPRTVILATSREILRTNGEYVYRVPPLEVPAADEKELDQILGHSAVELFVARAQALDYSPNGDALPLIADICRRLDGIPLAIEFAAARTATLGIEYVATGLNDRFALLTSGRRTALPRHRTLRATLDWSYELLSEAERELLRRLAIFAGPFPLEAASAVAAETMTANEIARGVADLVSKSLIIRSANPDASEFRLLETTRAYALQRLHESGALADVAHRHACFFLKVLAHVEETRQSRPADDYLPVFRRYTDEVHVALEWAFSPTGDPAIGLAITIAAVPLWFALFQMLVARARLEQALRYAERGSDDEIRLRIAMGHALWYTHIGLDIDILEQNFTRVLEIADHLGAKDAQILALWGLWAARRGRRDYPAALERARRFANTAESHGNAGAIHLADRILGLTHHFLGNQPVGREFTERALRNPHHLDSSLGLGYQVETPVAMAAQLARIRWVEGFPDRAMALSAQALTAALEIGHPHATFYALAYAGVPVALWVGDLAEASRRAERLIVLTTGSRRNEEWGRVLADVIELRKEGSKREALITSFVEPRVDLFSTMPLARMLSERNVPVPSPEPEPAEVLWNTPELLRVDAELLLWHNLPDAAASAEARLLRALKIAREQAALSWELRVAMSLARLMLSRAQPGPAKQVLGPVFRRFTEGFDTVDLKAAKALLDPL